MHAKQLACLILVTGGLCSAGGGVLAQETVGRPQMPLTLDAAGSAALTPILFCY